MATLNRMTRMATIVAVGAVTLAGCADTAQDDTAQPSPSQTESETSTPGGETSTGTGSHDHKSNGGPPPEGIEQAADPTYPVGTTVTLTADHMPGMKGSEATISGAFDTTAYSVSVPCQRSVTKARF